MNHTYVTHVNAKESKKLETKCSCCQIQYILVYSILLLLLYSTDVSFIHDVSSILLLLVYIPKRFCSTNFFKILFNLTYFDMNSFLMYMQYSRWLLYSMLLWCNEQHHAPFSNSSFSIFYGNFTIKSSQFSRKRWFHNEK